MENKIIPLIKGDKHYFFGYYNKSQISKDNKFAIVLEVDFIDRVKTEKDVANILLINLEDNTYKKIAETKAWNWQQGCMLQWMPKDYNTKITFNDLKNNKIISRILDIKTKEEKIIPYPIYDIHPSGKYALSFSFSKLNDVRAGYGYAGENYKEKASEEGISLINLENNTKKLIIKLDELKKYKPLNYEQRTALDRPTSI